MENKLKECCNMCSRSFPPHCDTCPCHTSPKEEEIKCNCGYADGLARWHSPACLIFSSNHTYPKVQTRNGIDENGQEVILEEPSPKEELCPYGCKRDKDGNCTAEVIDLDSPKEEVNYFQVDQTVSCGNCHPELFENCKSITEKYPYIICNCKCHSPKVSEWETEFDEKFTHMGKNQAYQLDRVWNGMVTITSMKKFISSLLSSTEKRVANEIIGEIRGLGDICSYDCIKIINLIKSKYEN